MTRRRAQVRMKASRMAKMVRATLLSRAAICRFRTWLRAMLAKLPGHVGRRAHASWCGRHDLDGRHTLKLPVCFVTIWILDHLEAG